MASQQVMVPKWPRRCCVETVETQHSRHIDACAQPTYATRDISKRKAEGRRILRFRDGCERSQRRFLNKRRRCGIISVDEENMNNDGENVVEGAIIRSVDNFEENINSDQENAEDEIWEIGHGNSENESEDNTGSERAEDHFDVDDDNFENYFNKDPEENNYEQPPYNGAPISVGESLMAILSLSLKFKLTGTCLVALLNLIMLFIPTPNLFKSTMYLFKKSFGGIHNSL
ncbi:hypothetical protein PV327_011188, partial [Microctonus hyperodae]